MATRKNKFKNYKKYFKNPPSTFRSKTDEVFEQRLIYENNLKIAWDNLFHFPSEILKVEGGFFYSLYVRCLPLLKEDWEQLKLFYRSHYHKKWTILKIIYVILLWILLLPPFYYFYLTFRYIVWRLPFYIFCFIESIFENLLFRKYLDVNKHQALYSFYNNKLPNIKGFFIDSWGLGFFRKLFSLPLGKSFFLDFVWRKKGRPHWEKFLNYILNSERRFRFMVKEIEEVGLFPYMIGLDRFYKWRRFYRKNKFLITLDSKGRSWVYAFWTVNKNYAYRNGRILRLQFLVEWWLLPYNLLKNIYTYFYKAKACYKLALPTIQYYLCKPLPHIAHYVVFAYRVLTVVPVYIINYIIPLKSNVPTFEYLRRKSFTLNRKFTVWPGLMNHKLMLASRNPHYVQRVKKLKAMGAFPAYVQENNSMGWIFLLVFIIFVFIVLFHIYMASVHYCEGNGMVLLDLPFFYYLIFII